MPSSYRKLVLVLFVALKIAISAEAQTLDRGEIHGTVRDESGAVVQDVRITLHDTITGFERTTVSTATGQYSAMLLPLGVYVVQAEHDGFAIAKSEPVPLVVGDALVVNLVLTLAALTESVSVLSPNTSPALGTTIDDSAIVKLPINGRDYRDFALLSPTAQTITGTRGTFRVAGQPGDYLALNVDGTDFTNNFFGEFFGSLETKNATIPLEAVQEFAVNTGGMGAESGRSNGGLVNVITKSGSNERHGTLSYFLRHHALTEKDAFGNPPTGLIRNVGGGSVGGPIVANRSFYFAAADIQRQTTPLTVKFAQNVHGIAVPELGIADLGDLEGLYPRHEAVTTFLAKIDQMIGSNHRLSVRTNVSRNQGNNIAGGSLILSQATSNLESFHNQGISTVASVSSALGPQLFLDTKVQVAGETRPRQPQGPGPQVQILDTGTFGGSTVLPATQDMYRYEASTNVAFVRGKHSLKVGGNYDGFNMRNNAFALALNGAYSFPTLAAFIQRQPSLYSQNFGLNGHTAEDAALLASFWQHEFATYVQDHFRPTSRLTFGIGFRYDAQFNPQPQAGTAGMRVPVGLPVIDGDHIQVTYASVPQGIPDDTNEWSPRGEVAYDFLGDGATILKGSTGFYHGRTPMIYFPVRGSGISNTTLFAPPSRFGVTFPQVLPSTITPGSDLANLLGPPAIQDVDPDFRNPTVIQVSASLTRAVGAGVSLEAGYLMSESRNLRIGGFRSTLWDRNLTPPTAFDEFGRGINILAGGRPDATITQANALTSLGHGRYQAFLITLRKPLREGWEFYVNYTLAKSVGNGSTERDTEALFGPSDPFNLEADYGINELDQRHQFKSYFTLTFPYDLGVAWTWSAGSGLAFPVYSGVDINRDGVTNSGLHPDRPIIDGQPAPRFPYHQPPFFSADLRVTKGIKVGFGQTQLALEIFNVLNNDNTYADPRTQAILGSPNFRVNNRTPGPRLAQLGLRFNF